MALERYLLDRLIQNYSKVADRSSVLHTGMALVAKGITAKKLLIQSGLYSRLKKKYHQIIPSLSKA